MKEGEEEEDEVEEEEVEEDKELIKTLFHCFSWMFCGNKCIFSECIFLMLYIDFDETEI